jgi:hypothetical protein
LRTADIGRLQFYQTCKNLLIIVFYLNYKKAIQSKQVSFAEVKTPIIKELAPQLVHKVGERARYLHDNKIHII